MCRSTTLVLVSFWNCWTHFDEYFQLLSRWKAQRRHTARLRAHFCILSLLYVQLRTPTLSKPSDWPGLMAAWGAGEPAGRNAGRVCVDAVRYDGNVCAKYICRNVFVFLNPVGASVCFFMMLKLQCFILYFYFSLIYIIFCAFICFCFFSCLWQLLPFALGSGGNADGRVCF